MFADEIIALQYGTPELNRIREEATKGDPAALKTYVYFCAWQGIRADRYIPPTMKTEVFRRFADMDLLSVSFAGVEPHPSPPDQEIITPEVVDGQ
jgi:hypothetical protein